jgi:hypothetical protein
LRHNLPREECAVVFTGFQAAGTLGRQIVDGATRVRLFREEVPVRASVHTIGGLSAHGDQDALLGWLRAFHAPPQRAFVVHGERETAIGFAALVREQRDGLVDVHRAAVESARLSAIFVGSRCTGTVPPFAGAAAAAATLRLHECELDDTDLRRAPRNADGEPHLRAFWRAPAFRWRDRDGARV